MWIGAGYHGPGRGLSRTGARAITDRGAGYHGPKTKLNC
jgi:hypothetical protein